MALALLPPRLDPKRVEASRFGPALRRLMRIRNRIRDVHVLLSKDYLLAVADDHQLFVFDVDPSSDEYALERIVPAPMPIPVGTRAAFPLDPRAARAACVVTPEAFDTLEGCVAIFHEFAHCAQWEVCELVVRQELEIARAAAARNDPMWEINHTFAYEDDNFTVAYSGFLDALESGDATQAHDCRRILKRVISPVDLEYLIWQEWKEGFARWIENRIRERLGLRSNGAGREIPFSRVSFYAGGALLVDRLVKEDLSLQVRLQELFRRIRDF